MDGNLYLVSFVDKLMSTSDEFQTIDMIELRSDFISEEPSSTTRRNSPSINILGITPYQVTKSSFVWDFLSTSDNADLINCADLGAQTTVNTKDFSVNNSCQNEEIKYLTARLPNRSVAILLLTFFVETVNLSDLAGLVVPANKSDFIWVPLMMLEGYKLGISRLT